MDKVWFPKKYMSLVITLETHDINFCSSWQQTNTADMLDLAVEYIKDLQKQYKVSKK